MFLQHTMLCPNRLSYDRIGNNKLLIIIHAALIAIMIRSAIKMFRLIKEEKDLLN